MSDAVGGVLFVAGVLSLAAWFFWTWMLWTIASNSQEQSETLQGILKELRKAKPGAEGTATRENGVRPVQRKRPRDEVTEDERAALEALGLSNEGTKPKPKGSR